MKHRLVQLCSFLVLGAIINVAVAWGCAATMLRSRQEEVAIAPKPSSGEEDHWRRIVEQRAIGCVRHQFRFDLRGSDVRQSGDEVKYVIPSFCGTVRSEPITTALPARIVAWSNLGFVEHDGKAMFIESELAAGWPLHGLCGCVNGVTHSAGHASQIHPMSIGLGASHTSPYKLEQPAYSLPLAPLWPCFAVNTLFYAAICWLLSAFPSAVRRMIRHRRGRCFKCGYDLRGGAHGVCPECGTPTKVTQP